MSFIIEVTRDFGRRSIKVKAEAPNAAEAVGLFERAERLLRGGHTLERVEPATPYAPTHFWPGWPGDPPRKPGQGEAAD
jgi:hypothetical protein